MEQNLAVLGSVGLRCNALDEAASLPTYSRMAPLQRYSFIKRAADCTVRVPVHFFPKYTKVQLPIDPAGTPEPQLRRKLPSKPKAKAAKRPPRKAKTAGKK